MDRVVGARGPPVDQPPAPARLADAGPGGLEEGVGGHVVGAAAEAQEAGLGDQRGREAGELAVALEAGPEVAAALHEGRRGGGYPPNTPLASGPWPPAIRQLRAAQTEPGRRGP